MRPRRQHRERDGIDNPLRRSHFRAQFNAVVEVPLNRLEYIMSPYLSKSKIVSIATALVFVSALSACAPRIQTRGNLPDQDRVDELKAGDISKNEVAEILGSPSTTGSFGNEAWFYISERTETLAWFEPKIMERKVLVLEFDKEGVLAEKYTVGLDAANKVIPNDRQTPTHGNKMTVIEQLVGNFRRFTGAE